MIGIKAMEAWIATEGLANVRAPIAIDVREGVWGVEDDAPFDAIVSLNMVHIAPWEAACRGRAPLEA